MIKAKEVRVLKAPFPWFGGKSKVAHLVWQRFGDVPNYVEPFAGSLAVLLGRPHEARLETVNDLDCYLANFWRATTQAPMEVAKWADWPVNEADLHARHLWLLNREEFRQAMRTDPDYFDAKVAGWWVWGLCQWIGSGWCAERNYNGEGNAKQQLPHLGDAGRGVHRPSQQLPHLGNAGRGDLYEYFAHMQARLRRVRVTCGDWSRVLGETVTTKQGVTGVFLDPPYAQDLRDDLYSVERSVSDDVRQWAIENGDNAMLRIALCGYADEHAMPDSWTAVAWKAAGGYGSQGEGRGRENAHKEMIWFSQHCLPVERQPVALSLFD